MSGTFRGPFRPTSSRDIVNLELSMSVASSALTIAAKTEAGSDPSSSNPVQISFGSSTESSGAYAVRSVTAALSVVVSSGSTLGHASAVASPIFVYALDNAGTVELAVSSKLFDETVLQSTTAEGGAGAADSATVLYSTTARSNVRIRLLGVLSSTQTTAGTWAAVPTQASVQYPWKPATALVSGYVSTEAQSFAGLKKMEGGVIDVGQENTTDANSTLTNASRRTILYSGLVSIGRDVTLPTTDIKEGEIFRIGNTSVTESITIKASNGNELTTANGCNLNASIRSGFCVLMALQDTPTTPAHWRVLHVAERGTFTLTLTGCTTSPTVTAYFSRVNSQVSLNIPLVNATSNAGTATLTGMLARLQPAREQRTWGSVVDNGTVKLGRYDVQTSGTINLSQFTSATAVADSFTSSGTKGTTISNVNFVLD